MSNKELRTRIVHKHDLEKNWNNASNFIPMKGEIIIYDIETQASDLPEGRTELYNYERVKIGDGATVVKNLPFITAELSFDPNIVYIFDAGTSGENISSALVEEENEAGGTTAVIG